MRKSKKGHIQGPPNPNSRNEKTSGSDSANSQTPIDTPYDQEFIDTLKKFYGKKGCDQYLRNLEAEKGGRCLVHNRPLEKGTAAVVYGYISGSGSSAFGTSKKDRLMRIFHFPLANSVEIGGCLIEENSSCERDVLYCPSCRAAEDIWVKNRSDK